MQKALNTATRLNWTGILQKRGFFQWINFVFNRVDESRVKAIGPDRAAAEWILRLGGDELKLEAIDAAGISVTDNGLEHLAGLLRLQVLNLSGCKYLEDGGLVHLSHVQDSLKHLDLSCIPGITENGLTSLYCLRVLETLNLANTPGIKHRTDALNKLKCSLPLCQIREDPSPLYT